MFFKTCMYVAIWIVSFYLDPKCNQMNSDMSGESLKSIFKYAHVILEINIFRS